jgi:hypothetical protein
MRRALIIFVLALLPIAARAKDAVNFSGTYAAKIKYDDGTTGTRTIHIIQTANSVQIEQLGSKATPLVYKFGEPVFVRDGHGKEHRQMATLSGRILRIDIELRAPADAVSGTQQTVYTLSKDGKRLTCTYKMATIGPSQWGEGMTDTYTRVEAPATSESK